MGNTLLTCLSLPRETGKMKTTFQPPGPGSSNAPVVMRHPSKTGSVTSGHSSKRGSVISFCYPEGLRSSRRRGSFFSVSQPDRRRQSSKCTTSKWQIAEVTFWKYSFAVCLFLLSTGDCGARATPHTAGLCADCLHGFSGRGEITVKV